MAWYSSGMPNITNVTEAEILAEVVGADSSELSPDAAQSFLAFKFSVETTRQIRKLLQKNNRGNITAPERLALEKYLRVGKFLDLVHARARLALNRSTNSR
jgi:hypothetical protein